MARAAAPEAKPIAAVVAPGRPPAFTATVHLEGNSLARMQPQSRWRASAAIESVPEGVGVKPFGLSSTGHRFPIGSVGVALNGLSG